jgi:hypothetical protein
VKPEEIDLSETANIYMIANTPLFLIRRLQADSSVAALSLHCGTNDLYSGIESALSASPENPVEAVRPFAYLIALRNHNDPDMFFKASELRAPYLSWYPTVARMLAVTFIPNTNVTLFATPAPRVIQFSGHGNSASEGVAVEDDSLSCSR